MCRFSAYLAFILITENQITAYADPQKDVGFRSEIGEKPVKAMF